MKKTRTEGRIRRKMKTKKHLFGTADRPRVFIFKSNSAITVGAADDASDKVLKSMSTKGKNIEAAEKLGVDFGKALKKMKVETLIFDRSGYKYHGVVKAIADKMRDAGLTF